MAITTTCDMCGRVLKPEQRHTWQLPGSTETGLPMWTAIDFCEQCANIAHYNLVELIKQAKNQQKEKGS